MHGKTICRICTKLISRCRCMAGHTHISYDTCAACAEAHKDKLPGGLGDDKTPEDFDPKAVEKGKKVELEHTDDPDLATEITLDHLTEDPLYYDKLETIESCFKAVTAKYAISALSIEVVVDMANQKVGKPTWSMEGREIVLLDENDLGPAVREASRWLWTHLKGYGLKLTIRDEVSGIPIKYILN